MTATPRSDATLGSGDTGGGRARLAPDAVAPALGRWIERHAAVSYDPYDGLMSERLAWVRRYRWPARICMQVVKRSPVNLRPWLGIRPALYTKSLSDLASAHLLLYRLTGHPLQLERARHHLAALRQRRLPECPGSCWGMDLHYVSRSARATPSTPNLFQTVNAVAAFLDAFELLAESPDLELATGFVEFLERGLGRLESGDQRLAWRYYPGVATYVYNVNALTGAQLLRLARHTGRADFAALGRRTLAVVVSEQNADGSWFYARGSEGRWVDGFHTGYVLEALLQAALLDPTAAVTTALQRGVDFFLHHLFTADSLPRYTSRQTRPLEVQNAAQAIQTLAKLAVFGRGDLGVARAVAQKVIDGLFVLDGDDAAAPAGHFILSRGRFFTNALASVRWGQAPMYLALAWLRAAEAAAATGWAPTRRPGP